MNWHNSSAGEGEGEGEGEGSSLSRGTGFRGVPSGLGYKRWVLDFSPDVGTGLSTWPAGRRIPMRATPYATSQWDPILLAVPAVIEFGENAASWKDLGTAFNTITDPDGVAKTLDAYEQLWRTQGSANFVSAELDYMQALMVDDRARYMPEIIGQANGMARYFAGVLGLANEGKPWTRALINFAIRTGELVVISHKRKYKRQRPTVLLPGLAAPFGPPRHPAFPSGHALQGRLVAELLCLVPNIQAGFAAELDWLATRIAKNRERAGLHYPSDSIAGSELAKHVVGTVLTGGLNAVQTYLNNQNIALGVLTEQQIAQVAAGAAAGNMPELWNLIENAKTEW